MKPIQIISQDLFDKIRSRFSNLEMGTEEGGVTIDPAEARFFDFDFVVEENNLGRISISINDPGSLKIYYSQGITEDQDSGIKNYWYNFLKEMRFFAKRRLLRFDTRDISKSNLDKNDFQYLASKKPKEENAMNMNESRWTGRNTSKTSRRVQGTTQVIVRHKNRVNEMLPADRSKSSNITAIFIQNKDGERFKAPFNYLPLAFALAQHIDHGGVPYDAPAKKIIGMCEQIVKLSEFKKHVKTPTLHGESLGIVEKAVGRLNELKSTLEALGKRRHYESWLAEFNESEENLDDDLIELSPVQMEEYKAKFTHSEFNETLSKYFPLIHSIMQEKVDLEEFVSEEKDEESNEEILGALGGGALGGAAGFAAGGIPGAVGGALSGAAAGDSLTDPDADEVENEGFEKFEEWAEAVESGKLDLNKIKDNLGGDDLSQRLSGISLGPDGASAWAELSSIFDLDERDSDDESLKNQLQAKAETADQEATGLDSPVMDVFKSWVEDSFPQWKQDLPELFPPEQSPEQPLTPEPETGMQPAQEPQAGVNPNATPGPDTGMNPAAKPQPVAEDRSKSMIRDIAETVKKYYNSSNEEVGAFRSEEAVCLEVEKTIGEKYGESAAKKAGMIAKQFMEKLTRQWEMKHHKDRDELKPVDDDGLARLKELVSNIKTKVEGMSQPSGTEENFDPNDIDPNKAKIPAYQRKQEFPVKQATDKAMADRNEKSGANVWHSNRKESINMEEILKLAGLTK